MLSHKEKHEILINQLEWWTTLDPDMHGRYVPNVFDDTRVVSENMFVDINRFGVWLRHFFDERELFYLTLKHPVLGEILRQTQPQGVDHA